MAGWRRKQIDLATNAALTADVAANTLFIRVVIDDDTWDFFTNHADGDEEKVRFSDSGGNLLNFTIEAWDHASNLAIYLVEQPALEGTTGDTIIYIHYGVSSYPSGDTADALFPAEIKGYFPLDEDCPRGYLANLADRTGQTDLNEFDGANLTTSTAGHGGGKGRAINSEDAGVGKAGLYTTLGRLSFWEDGTDCTLSFSLKHGDFDASVEVFGGYADAAWPDDAFVFFHNASNVMQLTMRDSSAASNITVQSTASTHTTLASWRSFTFYWDGTDETGFDLYEDNSEGSTNADSGTWTAFDTTAGSLWFGFNSDYYNYPANVGDHDIDSVIATNGIAWTADIEAVKYNNQTQGWLTFGSETATAPPLPATQTDPNVTANLEHRSIANTDRTATTGTLQSQGSSFSVGVEWTGVGVYYRGFIEVDLTHIPAGASFRTASLYLYVNSESYGPPSHMRLYEGTQSDTIVAGDFDAFNDLYFAEVSIAGTGWDEWILNADGLAFLTSKIGSVAKLCLRDYNYDVAGVSPKTNDELAVFASPQASSNQPYLDLSYVESQEPRRRLMPPPQQGVVFNEQQHFIFAATPDTARPAVYIADKSDHVPGAVVELYEHAYNVAGTIEVTSAYTVRNNKLGFYSAASQSSATNYVFSWIWDNDLNLTAWRRFTTTNDLSRMSTIVDTQYRIAYLESGAVKIQQSTSTESGGDPNAHYSDGGAALDTVATIKTLTGSDTYTQLIKSNFTTGTQGVLYTDTVSTNIKLYYRALDTDGDILGGSSEIEIADGSTNPYLKSLSSFRCVPLYQQDKFLLVYRGADNKLYYAFVADSSLDSWGSVSELIPSGDSTGECTHAGDGYFTVVGPETSKSPSVADVFYYDGTDIRRTTATNESWGASSQFVATAAPADGFFQAPYEASNEYVMVYVNTDLDFVVTDVAITADDLYGELTLIDNDFYYGALWNGSTNISATFGTAGSEKTFIILSHKSGYFIANRLNVSDQTFDFSWTRASNQISDMAHSWCSCVVDDDGYVYFGGYGRHFASSTIAEYFYHQDDLFVLKSDYPLNHGSFSLDFENDWTDISPDASIIADHDPALVRGYVRLVVDHQATPVVYLFIGDGGATASLYVLEYRSASWSDPFQLVEYTTPAQIQIYVHDIILNRESSGQKSLVITYGNQSNAAGGGVGYVDFNIVKAIPDGDGTFSIYAATDSTESTLLNVADAPLDYGDGELIYENPDNHPTANWLEVGHYGKVVMEDQDTPIISCYMVEPNNLDARVGDTAYYTGHYILRPDDGGGDSTFPEAGWTRYKVIDSNDADPALVDTYVPPRISYTDSGTLYYPVRTLANSKAQATYLRSTDGGATFAGALVLTDSSTANVNNLMAFEVTDTRSIVVVNADVNDELFEHRFLELAFELSATVTGTDVALAFPAGTFVSPDVDEVEVWRHTASPATDGSAIGDGLAASTATYDDNGLAIDTYYYLIIYKDGGVEVDRSNEVSAQTSGLACDGGSFTLTGAAASLLQGYALDLDAGAFTETGAAASFLKDWALPLATDSFTLTGAACNLEWGRLLDCAGDSYTLTGNAATLLHGYKLTLDAASYTLTGAAAGLYHNYTLALASNAYTLTGSAQTYSRTYAPPLAGGSYTYTAAAATLTADRTLALDSSSYTLTGADLEFNIGFALPLAGGSFAWTGSDQNYERNYAPPLVGGTYTFTGADCALKQTHIFTPLETGTYVLSGADASLEKGYTFDLDGASYALAGSDATLQRAISFTCETTSYTLSGADIVFNITLPMAGGSYALTCADATFDLGRVVEVEHGTFALVGADCSLQYGGGIMNAEGGVYVLTGADAALSETLTIALEGATFTYTAAAANFYQNKTLTLDTTSYTLTGNAAALTQNYYLSLAAATAYSLTGADADFDVAYSLALASGACTLTGADVTLTKGQSAYTLALDVGAFTLTGADITLSYIPTTDFDLVCDTGAFTATGSDLAMPLTRALSLASGSIILTGADASFRLPYEIECDAASFLLTGAAATLTFGQIEGILSFMYESSQLTATYTSSQPTITFTSSQPTITFDN